MIVSVNEIFGRKTKRTEKAGRSYTRVFQVLCDSLQHTANEVSLAVGIPRRWDVHPDDIGAMATSVEAAQDTEEGLNWTVTVEYSTASTDTREPGQRNDNPTQRSATVSIDFEDIEVAVDVDLDGKLILNTAGFPFDPPVKITRSITVFTIEKNVSYLDYQAISEFNDSVNDDDFLGFEPDELWMKLRADKVYENNQSFWKLRATIKAYPIYVQQIPWPANADVGFDEILMGGWQTKILNAGYHAYIFPEGVAIAPDDLRNYITRIRDKSGAEIITPTPLNAFGEIKATDEKPIFLDFRTKRRKKFADLHLL